MSVPLAAALGAALLSLWLLPQFSLYAEQYRRHLDGPLGHDVGAWRDSPATLEIRAKSLDGRAVFGTNSTDVAPYLTGVRDKFRFLPCMTTNEARAWVSRAGEQNKDAYIVWFDGFINPIGCGAAPSAIRAVADMETLARLPNGNIFRASPSANPLEPYRVFYASLASREPIASSIFDVHLSGRTMAYLREDCAPSDAQARFFLHVIPVNKTDLPRERRRSGFNNFDFSFDMDGARFDGKCLTTAILPDYPIARIRTGQFIRGGSKVWEEEFRLPP